MIGYGLVTLPVIVFCALCLLVGKIGRIVDDATVVVMNHLGAGWCDKALDRAYDRFNAMNQANGTKYGWRKA